MKVNKIHPAFHFLTIHRLGLKGQCSFSMKNPPRVTTFVFEDVTQSMSTYETHHAISNCLRLLDVRVFSPSAAILENKKTLGMRLAWARKVDSPISCLKTVIAFLLCIAYMKIQCLSQHSRCATDTSPILDRQVLMHCRHSTETIATTR